MTAKGKINASNVTIGDRIIVKARFDAEGHETISESATKTGEGVFVARVVAKTFRAAQGPYEARGKYVIETSAGSFEAAPIQTMWLAPEDPAGIKRAYAEAVAEDAQRQASVKPLTTPATEAEEEFVAKTMDTSTELAQSLIEADHEMALGEDEVRADENRWTLGDILTMHETALEINKYVLTRAQVEENAAEVERLSLAAAEAARDENEAPGGIYHGAQWGSPAFDPEAGASAPDANRHISQTGGITGLTLDSQAGKVDNMNNASETETPATSTENHTGSTVVSLLEKVWARIRADHPELPEVVIITGSGLVGASKWGHFRAEGWKVKEEGAAIRKHELFLAGEALAKGATQVLQTMLHEGAHTLARVRDLKDTSRQGRWHNATFRKLAEEMGLEHKGTSADSSHGFSFVTLTVATKERYADLLEELDQEIRLVCHLPVWLGGSADEDDEKGGEKIGKAPKGEDEEGKAKSGNVKATCECEEPNIIRMSRKVLDKRTVRCGECEELFTESA